MLYWSVCSCQKTVNCRKKKMLIKKYGSVFFLLEVIRKLIYRLVFHDFHNSGKSQCSRFFPHKSQQKITLIYHIPQSRVKQTCMRKDRIFIDLLSHMMLFLVTVYLKTWATSQKILQTCKDMVVLHSGGLSLWCICTISRDAEHFWTFSSQMFSIAYVFCTKPMLTKNISLFI